VPQNNKNKIILQVYYCFVKLSKHILCITSFLFLLLASTWFFLFRWNKTPKRSCLLKKNKQITNLMEDHLLLLGLWICMVLMLLNFGTDWFHDLKHKRCCRNRQLLTWNLLSPPPTRVIEKRCKIEKVWHKPDQFLAFVILTTTTTTTTTPK